MVTKSTGSTAGVASSDDPGGRQIPAFRNIVKPVSNAINIVRFLGKTQRAATVTQMARHLAINPSTCFNIVRTLAYEGLVDFDDASKSYSVGLGLVRLAEGVLTESDRLALVTPKLHEVAERYGITLLLWRRVGSDRMLLVAVENSSANLQIHLRRGQRLPLLLGATGRVVASHLGLTKQQIREKFRQLRWARRLPFEDYWRDVLVSAKRGWSVDDGYFGAGATTVATPVFDSAGGVSHSLVGIMFRGQHPPLMIRRIGQDLILLSKELSTVFS